MHTHLGRVSAMSGGARQLFDPEAPPRQGADDPTEDGGRPGVLSIGGLYDQVEDALTRPFPGIATSGSGARSSTSRTTARATSTWAWSTPTTEAVRPAPRAGAACRRST